MDTSQLQSELNKLKALVEAFQLLNSSLDLQTVLDYTLTTAVNLMEAEMGSLALIDETKENLIFVKSTDPEFSVLKTLKVPLDKGIAGYVARTGEIVRVEDTSKDPHFYSEIDKKLKHQTHTYLCVPLINQKNIIGTAQLMNRRDGGIFKAEDEELFMGFARQAALAIQNASLHQSSIRQKALETELRISKDIQNAIYPDHLPEFPGYEFYGEIIQQREVGGDYYSLIPREDGSLDAIIGDVSGKGIPAALLVSEVHTGIQLLSHTDRALPEIIGLLSNHMSSGIQTGRFVTFFIARLRPDSHEFEYVTAGHPPPWIIRSNTKADTQGEEKFIFEELENTGALLGLPNNKIRSAKNSMQQGDIMLAFSDAYSESKSPEGDLLGEELLARFASEKSGKSLKEIADYIKIKALEYRGGQPPADDATLLIIRRK
jgi:phosphoserine phosphatase RsbU/P